MAELTEVLKVIQNYLTKQYPNDHIRLAGSHENSYLVLYNYQTERILWVSRVTGVKRLCLTVAPFGYTSDSPEAAYVSPRGLLSVPWQMPYRRKTAQEVLEYLQPALDGCAQAYLESGPGQGTTCRTCPQQLQCLTRK